MRSQRLHPLCTPKPSRASPELLGLAQTIVVSPGVEVERPRRAAAEAEAAEAEAAKLVAALAAAEAEAAAAEVAAAIPPRLPEPWPLQLPLKLYARRRSSERQRRL